MANLKKQILAFRARRNMSQRAFAKLAGVSETTIVSIETGKNKKVTRLTEAKIMMAIEDSYKEEMTSESV